LSGEHYVAAVREAVAIGNDTDTVAAIAGSLVGATYGLRAIPVEWQNGLRGWPKGYQLIDLIRLAERTVASAPESKE
jgi:ADP-ribosylglycohydrolase